MSHRCGLAPHEAEERQFVRLMRYSLCLSRPLPQGTMTTLMHDDAELVRTSLGGDREAFGAIVSRYQSLVCAVTYSGTGSLAASEDVAQETFITAWKRLNRLSDPSKLRPWLCGIARNLANNYRRRTASAMSNLESAGEQPAPGPTPHEQAVNREEERMVWDALEALPEQYREPLILFYREGQSAERVADELGLSPDATRQRLSRGRTLLREQVAALVETALVRSAPGRAFTTSVIAMLPAMKVSATAATLGSTAVKGTAAAKAAASMGVAGAIAGPFLGLLGALVGLFGGWAGTRASIRNTHSPRERQFVVSLSKIVWAFALLFTLAQGAIIWVATHYWRSQPTLVVITVIVIMASYAAGLVSLIIWGNRRQRLIRAQETPDLAIRAGRLIEFRSRSFLGLPLLHVVSGKMVDGKVVPAKGWIAIGDQAHGILFAAGGIAVGAISCGGVSFGLISLGGISIGALSLGGFALGIYALGGGAIGYIAAGGAALALHAGVGGLAIARDFALGGMAIAAHTNDAAARDFFAHGGIVQSLFRFLMKPWAELCVLLWVLVTLLWQRALLLKNNQ